MKTLTMVPYTTFFFITVGLQKNVKCMFLFCGDTSFIYFYGEGVKEIREDCK